MLSVWVLSASFLSTVSLSIFACKIASASLRSWISFARLSLTTWRAVSPVAAELSTYSLSSSLRAASASILAVSSSVIFAWRATSAASRSSISWFTFSVIAANFLVIVEAKLGSSPNALAISSRVSSTSGAEPIIFSIAASTSASVW